MTRNVNSTKRGWRLILCVVLAMVLALTMFLTACNNDNDDDTTPSTSPSTSTSTNTDTLPIKNGNFERITETEGTTTTYPITSVTSWTRSYDYRLESSEKAPDTSSAGKSGIINVKPEIFNNGDVSVHGLNEAQNPGTPDVKDGDGNSKDIGTKILMLRNATPTALKYTTSSSVSVAANTYVKITIWVKTLDLKDYFGNEAEEGGENKFGANITISNTNNPLNGQNAYDSVSVRNINTFGEWEMLTFYMEGSTFQSNTLYIALGLGKGDKFDKSEYASGYAFFDECNLEKISKKQYLEETASANEAVKSTEKQIQVFDYSDADVADKPVKLSFKDAELTDAFAGFDSNADWNIGAAQANISGTTVKAPEDSAGIKGHTTLSALSSGYDGAFDNFPFANEDIFMLENKIATSYIASTNNNGNYVVPAGKRAIVSLWVKTSSIPNGCTGAGITLITKGIDGGDSDERDWVYNSFTDIDTTGSNTINSEEDREKNPEYFWENWQQYSFIIQNSTADDIIVGLRLSLGATDISNIDPLTYTKGWAAFTNMTAEEITAEQYSNASSSSSQTKKVDLYYGSYTTDYDKGFDSVSSNNPGAVQNAPALPANWDYVSGNQTSIGGSAEYSGANTISGIVSAADWESYKAELPELTLDVSDWKGIGDRPLMIFNKDFASYGYVSKNRTLSANSFYQISVNVKVIGSDAKAYFYLTDTNVNAKGEEGVKPYSKLKFKIPASSVNEETEKEIYFMLPETVSLSNTNTADVVNLGDGWIKLSFFIATGDTPVTYRAEVWNGDRYATDVASGYSKGYVFFNNFSESKSMTEAEFTAVADHYKEYYNIERDDEGKYPANVTEFKREKNEDETEEPEAVIAYMYTDYAKFTDMREIDIVEEEEEETTDEEEPEDTNTFKDTSWLLLISSLLLAVVLIIVIVVYSVRRMRSGLKKSKKKALSGYNKSSRDKLRKKKADDGSYVDVENTDENADKDATAEKTEEEISESADSSDAEEKQEEKADEEESQDDTDSNDSENNGNNDDSDK